MPKTEIIVEPGKQEIRITRVFDAPPELVFEAMTDPEQVPHWWGPRRFETVVDNMEPRPGGLWRILNRDAEGNEHVFHGVYHDVVSPQRIVQTFEYEGAPGHVSLETMTLEDLGGKTRATTLSVFQSVAARDGMVGAGMEEGARETWERLAEIVEKKPKATRR